VRITTAFLDLNDKLLDLRGRVGRQTTINDGNFGIFDGAKVSYRFPPVLDGSRHRGHAGRHFR